MLSGTEIWVCENCRRAMIRAMIPEADQPLWISDLLPCSIAAYQYESPVQELVHALKYKGDPLAAAPLAEGMARAFTLVDCAELRRVELLIPVPLHPTREKERGYNQAALLAERLAYHVGLPHYPDALERIRHTRRQVGTSRESRLNNMLGAFTVAQIPLIYRKHVLLVDDVCTTGATAIACAQALLACGAAEVSLISACRA